MVVGPVPLFLAEKSMVTLESPWLSVWGPEVQQVEHQFPLIPWQPQPDKCCEKRGEWKRKGMRGRKFEKVGGRERGKGR